MMDMELRRLLVAARKTRLMIETDPECSPEVYVNPLAAQLADILEKYLDNGQKQTESGGSSGLDVR
jgi:hypothetical protein